MPKGGEKSYCSITGCASPVKGHGLCNKHLRRKEKHGDPNVPGRPSHWGKTPLICVKCGCGAPDVVLRKEKGHVCNKCRPRTAPKEKRRYIFLQYGLTETAVLAMLSGQKNACKICERQIEGFGAIHSLRPYIDHDHVSGKVRGILCRDCNLALGLFYDKTSILAAAIQYLEESRECP